MKLQNIQEARYHQVGEDMFWDFVREANWKSDYDYKRIGTMLEHVGKTTALELQKIYDEKSSELYEWLWDPIHGVSDDGFSDLVSHTIGLGKEFYDAVIKDPSVAQKLVDNHQYEEGFQYIWHILYDLKWVKRYGE